MLRIRKMAERDLDQVAAMAAAVFSEPWSRQGFAETLPMENVCFLVAKEEETVLGYAGLSLAADEGEIINVAVSPAFRRRGIACGLMRALLAEGAAGGIRRFFLEVRVSNTAAVCLYQKYGFTVRGRRKNFYTSPREDAYVMNFISEEEAC